MSVACYTELCEIMMKLTDDRFVESQAFLKLQFTVIGRSNTTASVNWKNTKIEGDHLSTFHSNNKKDQAGTDKSTKACYANPFDPCTCLFTALGIWQSHLERERERERKRFLINILENDFVERFCRSSRGFNRTVSRYDSRYRVRVLYETKKRIRF
jgi:hypothetical protein